MGMSLAFALDLLEAPSLLFRDLFYPRILQRGLLNGLNASEFPLLNFLTAPLWIGEPWIGATASVIFLLGVNLLAALIFLPRLLRLFGVSLSRPLGVTLWFSSQMIAERALMFMPEGFALALVVAGLVLILENSDSLARPKTWLGILLTGLAVAVKPTLVPAFGVALLWALKTKPESRRTLRVCLALGVALLFPAWWYTVHVETILAMSEGPQIFKRAEVSPLENLRALGWRDSFELLNREIVHNQFPFAMGWIIIALALLRKQWLALLAWLTAFVLILVLGGRHIRAHEYYFIGSSLFAVLLMALTLQSWRSNRIIHALLLAIISFGLLYGIRTNIITARKARGTLWAAGAQAAALIPEDHHLITDDSRFPAKLLRIGRSGTIAGSQALKMCTDPRYAGRKLAIVVDMKLFPDGLPATPCQAAAKLDAGTVPSPSGAWKVLLVH